MKFNYHKTHLAHSAFPNHKTKLTPIIPIFIKYRRKLVRHYIMIDSGADHCLFHSDLGRQLGIQVESGKELLFEGVTSDKKVTGYIHNVTFLIAGKIIEKVPVIFSSELSHNTFGLAGQYGFFDKFKVIFDYKKGTIEIK